MTPSARLAELDLQLPEVAAPVGSYVPATRCGDWILTSGQIPMVGGKPLATGKVGAGVSLDTAREAARLCVLNAVAAAASVAGGVDQIAQIVRVCVFVASTENFTDQPQVANVASDLLVEIFGEAGRHVRSAVGVASLPLDVPVELELVVSVRA